MHDIIPKLFDCWADPVAHLLLLKSSMLRRFYIALILEKLLKVKQERNGSITNMIRCFKETNDWVHATNGSLPVSGTNLKYFRTLNEGIN